MARKLIALLVLPFCFSIKATCADFPGIEIFGSVSAMRTSNPNYTVIFDRNDQFRISFPDDRTHHWLAGLKTGIAFNLNSHLGIVGEFGWNRRDRATYKTLLQVEPGLSTADRVFISESIPPGTEERSEESINLLGGPRISTKLAKRFKPFAQFLVGWNRHNTYETRSYSPQRVWSEFLGPQTYRYKVNISVPAQTYDSFAVAGGGGLDLGITKRLSLRLFELEFLGTREDPQRYTLSESMIVSSASGMSIGIFLPNKSYRQRDSQGFSHLRFSMGAVFHFGKQ